MRILDSSPEDLFDSLASAASAICGGGNGMINLLDRDRLWTKGVSEGARRCDMPHRHTMCAHTVRTGTLVEIADLTLDPSFAANPVVTRENGYRFYAGVPLRLSDGSCVGALCVLDTVPRRLDDHQRRALAHLATAIVHALEARRRNLDAVSDARQAHLALDGLYDAAPAILQVTDAKGRLVRVTDRWLQEFGLERDAVIGRPFAEMVEGRSNDGSVVEGQCRVRHADGHLLDMLASSMVERDEADMPVRCVTVLENVSATLATRNALEHSQSFLERSGAVAGVGGWEIDPATRTLIWSDHTCRLHDHAPGHTPTLEEALSHYTPAARPIISDALRRAMRHGEPWDLELAMVSATGRPFWARVAGTVEMRDGVPVRISGAFQDITGRKQLERQLAESRQLLETTLQSIGDAVITTDMSSTIGWMNPVAENMTGWNRRQAEGIPLGVVMPVSDATPVNPVERAVLRCLGGGPAETIDSDATLHGADRGSFAIQGSAAPIRDAASEVLGAVVVFRDVSEQRMQQEELERRATHDPLTGLLNHAGLTSALEALLRRMRGTPRARHALLCLDLDRFKIVNDSCGHSVGDSLLRDVSALLRSSVRPADIVARLGGDEFGIVLADCTEKEANEVAERIRAQVDAYRLYHENCGYRVGISIGLVPIDARWNSLQSLLQAGDMACYAAKESGRNCVHAWSEADGTGADHPGATQWVARLESALQENRFELFGQRIDCPRGPAAGLRCEVLLRMRDSDGSLLLPGAFIAAAERFHMAPMLDRWVLRRVLDWLDAIAGDGITLLTANVSGQSLGDRTFRRDVVHRLRQARFDLSILCLEITETSAIARFAEAKIFIDEIRALGVKVALDDFGAGASSFSYLKNLTVDILKIDGQFVRNLPDDPLDLAAIRCFRDIAHSVNIMTVAETVERQDQYEVLASLGIDMIQGYMIHRPEPLDRLMPEPFPAPMRRETRQPAI